ncbi:MAG: hypothetical protein JWP34_5296 [Massilia sp.]|nr:hypothetical protein [Massilia sp.]
MEHKQTHAIIGLCRVSDDLDYHAKNFVKLLLDAPSGAKTLGDAVIFEAIAGTDFDFFVYAHRRKFFVKYSHVIKQGDSGPQIRGYFQMFSFEQDRVSPIRLSPTPIETIEIDGIGEIYPLADDLCCSPNTPFESQTSKALIMRVMQAVQRSITEA